MTLEYRIMDETGRIGIIEEDRGMHGLFARPIDKPRLIQGHNCSYMTATHWAWQADGTLRGLWYDSKPGAFRTAIRREKDATLTDELLAIARGLAEDTRDPSLRLGSQKTAERI